MCDVLVRLPFPVPLNGAAPAYFGLLLTQSTQSFQSRRQLGASDCQMFSYFGHATDFPMPSGNVGQRGKQ
jgi:hypothetical protein